MVVGVTRVKNLKISFRSTSVHTIDHSSHHTACDFVTRSRAQDEPTKPQTNRIRPNHPTTSLSYNSSTLAIDGNSLLFHLFRLSYYHHYKNVTSSNQSKSVQSLQSQLLLPSFVPLALAHEVTTHYLSSLTIQHGIHLKIYFDGSNQFMKRLEKASRKERREDEWENVQQFCLNGVLPQSGTNKFRSSARRQAKGCELNNGSDRKSNPSTGRARRGPKLRYRTELVRLNLSKRI